jgi:hypothetical protein
MKLLIIQTILFITKKWNYEIQENLTTSGKIFLFFPWLINSLLTQMFYFSIFPLTMLYVKLINKLSPYLKIIEEYRRLSGNNV